MKASTTKFTKFLRDEIRLISKESRKRSKKAKDPETAYRYKVCAEEFAQLAVDLDR